MNKSWRDAFSAYADRRILVVLAMGFSSGLPLALTGVTLGYWLRSTGVSLTEITLLKWATIAYSVKFLWAPLLDHFVAPWLGRRLGRRRGWALVTQAGLIATLLWMGSTDPASSLLPIALAAAAVAFFSASQDIVIDAYRVEILDPEQQGAGASATQTGYQIGMLTSNAGALLLSTVLDWQGVYMVMAALVGVGILAVALCTEPPQPVLRDRSDRLGKKLRDAVLDPLIDFAKRPRWPVILAFVVLYKLSDALAGALTNPFYRDMGFTAAEIASVTKIVALIATLLGVFVGGALVARLGVMSTLIVGGIVQAATNALFSVVAIVGHDLGILGVAVFLENFTAGIGSAALVAYLSQLCSLEFTGTQFALLSSLASLGRTVLSSGGGWIADQIGWVGYFLFTTAAGLPGLIILLWLMKAQPSKSSSIA